MLEVHEQLEMPQVAEQQQGEGDMDDMEKALIRQMCNVRLDVYSVCINPGVINN